METCGHDDSVVYLHSKCHPASPTWVSVRDNGTTMLVECAECGKEIIMFRGSRGDDFQRD